VPELSRKKEDASATRNAVTFSLDTPGAGPVWGQYYNAEVRDIPTAIAYEYKVFPLRLRGIDVSVR